MLETLFFKYMRNVYMKAQNLDKKYDLKDLY